MSAFADLETALTLYRHADGELPVDQHPDPLPILREMCLLLRAQDARILELEDQVSVLQGRVIR